MHKPKTITKMTITIIDQFENEIASYDLETNPFTVGEIIEISISNNNKDIWNVDELDKQFQIDTISHYLRINYSNSLKRHVYHYVIVKVSPIDD